MGQDFHVIRNLPSSEGQEGRMNENYNLFSYRPLTALRYVRIIIDQASTYSFRLKHVLITEHGVGMNIWY